MRPLLRSTMLLQAGCLFLCFSSNGATFRSAKPVWPSGRGEEINLAAGFRAVVNITHPQPAVLRITAASLYRAFVNGQFLGHGPARGPHGYFRVDEWRLTGKLRPGKNLVAVEVAGYNVNSYYLLKHPPFLAAEVESGGQILASTAGEGVHFEGRILTDRLQRVERFSVQRTFTESYRLRPDYDQWRLDPSAPFQASVCSVVPCGSFLPRRVPYPDFTLRRPLRLLSSGHIQPVGPPARLWRSRGLTSIGPNLLGFKESELEIDPSRELQMLRTELGPRLDKQWLAPPSLALGSYSYHIVDFGTNLTGFLSLKVVSRDKTRLILVFDEILSSDDVDFKRLGAAAFVSYQLEPGAYNLETIEPYTLRYLKLIVLEGGCRLDEIYLREYANPEVWRAHFAASDERLNRLFAAGRETFRQNAVDIFMDCPSRERAGWLCDSFFTSRVALDLSGDALVEKNFLENYLLPDSFPHLPKCMLPMCYPSDHYSGTFIPNWALWFVLELEEYLERSGDRETIRKFEPKLMCLFDYFKKFRNEDGLLEKLPSWVFIEWSKANEFVQDVNYPSNMLYAAALETAGRLYQKPKLMQEAERIREAIRKQSFNGEFFVDNAVRRQGKLELTRNTSEVCQYFAFFFGAATPSSHPDLWRTICDRFGPDRVKKNLYPLVYPANSFVGNVLRLELLSRYGKAQQLLDESISYLLYMADRTGTIWENTTPSASCNHGFGSHIVHVLFRDILGLYKVDPLRHTVKLRFNDLPLEWCEGAIPVTDGRISLRWRINGSQLTYRVDVPSGYTVEIENLSGKKLVNGL